MRKSGAKRKHLDPMGCINMRMPIDVKHAHDFSRHYRAALLAFTNGIGSRQHWQTLADALNVARKLCEDGTGSEYTDDVIKAQFAVKSCLYRYRDSGRWGLSGDELNSVKRGLNIADAQYEISSPLHLRTAMRNVIKSVAMGDHL